MGRGSSATPLDRSREIRVHGARTPESRAHDLRDHESRTPDNRTGTRPEARTDTRIDRRPGGLGPGTDRRTADAAPDRAGFGRRLIGRGAETEAITGVLDGAADPTGPAGVLFVGPPGVGLTRLAQEAAALAHERGWTVQHLVATHPSLRIDLDTPPADGRFLVVVDDAHLLPVQDAVALHRLAITRAAVVVLTARTGAPAHESVIALWKDGAIERSEIAPLTREGHEELIVTELDGQVDGSTSARLWQLARGNVRYLAELVVGGRSAGSLVPVSGVWTWRGPLELPSRLLDLIGLRIGDLTAEETLALELVAAGEPAGIDVLIKAGATLGALESLETAGVLAVARSGRRLVLCCAHPLITEAVRARSGHLRTRGLHQQLAAAWVLVAGRRGDDALRLSVSLLAGGDAVPPELGTAAAARACRLMDFPLAERLARGALQSGGGAVALELLGAALVGQGRALEAEEVLGAFTTTGASDGHIATVAITRAANLQWGLDRPEQARLVLAAAIDAVTHPRVRSDLRVLRARVLMGEGHFAQSHELMTATLAHADATRPIRPFLAVTQVIVLSAMGRTEEALERGRAGLALIEEPEDQAGPVVREELLSQICETHLLRGELDEALAIADAGYRRATTDRYPLLAAWWAARLGKVALAQGRGRQALRFMREAAVQVDRPVGLSLYSPMVRRVVMRELSRAHAFVGDLDAAEEVLAELADTPDAPFAFVDLWQPDPAIWTTAARGNRAEAIRLAVEHADRVGAEGGNLLELVSLHHVVRMGEADQVVDRMTELGPTVDGELAAILVRHARALADRDSDALEGVARGFAGLGAFLLAAEVGGQAIHVHESAGREASARRAAAVAQRWLATCEGANTPALTLLREPPGLTARQRQIARLAAQGMASRAIAERLVLSVRTVDNSLGQIYRRLGITNRSELAPVLGLAGVGPGTDEGRARA